jgi:phospholipid/cholesterol/gamma-HCH transport system substrate-binding protein
MDTTLQYMKAWSKPLAGLVLVVGVVLLLLLNYTGALGNLFSGSSPTVTAVFADTKTLSPSDPVRVNGVQVGTVLSIKPMDGDRESLVKMSVSKDAGSLYKDATAMVRWRTVLGGAFYVAIDPGHPGTGQLPDDRIPAQQTTSEVELDDVTSVIQGGAKTGLQKLFPALGQALKDPHVLGNLLTEVNGIAPSATTGLDALRGEVQDTDLTGLIKNADATVNSLNAPDGELKATVQGAAATLDTIAANSGALQDTLETAPSTERIADRTLTALDTTLGLANPLISKLQRPSTQISPTLNQLQPVVTKANTLLSNATPLLASLDVALPTLSKASKHGTSLLTSLQPSLTKLQGTVLPYLLAKDPETGHSAAEMVGSGLTGLAMAAAPEDENGHYLYFPASTGNSFLYGPCQEFLGNSQEKLLECESLSNQISTLVNYSPLGPAAGTATTPTTTSTTASATALGTGKDR